MKNTPVFSGEIHQGKLYFKDAKMFRDYLKEIEGDVEISVKQHYRKRSERENRYYWGVVVPILAQHFGYTKDEMHDALKWQFMRKARVGDELVIVKLLELMDEQAVQDATKREILRLVTPYLWETTFGKPATVGSTASLNTSEFEDLMERIRMWAAEEFQVLIPLPNQGIEQLQ